MSKKLVVSGLLLTLTMVNLTAYAGEQYLQQRQQEQAERQRIQQERYSKMYNSNGFSSSLMDTVNSKGSNVDEEGNLIFSGPSDEEVERLRNMRWKQW